MYWSSVLFFIVACYGLGYLSTFFVKNAEDALERHLMRIGIGLGAFVALGYVFNLLRIPLDYRLFLAVIAVGIAATAGHHFWKHKNLLPAKPSFSTNICTLGMLILFAVTFFMYHQGAFAYPYLEDDDPWPHATGAKYVSIEKTVFAAKDSGLRYIDPYPPAYDMVMGILHQTNSSLFWTLKFFNALIISLSIIFFYFFSHELLKSSKKAFYSTAVLFAVPAFMSHFIWAISLTMPLMFVAFYALERIAEDRKWTVPSLFVIGATLAISPSHSTYFGLLFALYAAVRTILARRFLWHLYAAGFFGALLSGVMWWIPAFLKHGFMETVSIGANPTIFGVGGTADRQYYLADFAIAQKQNMINNPIGLGLIVFLLLLFALVFIFLKHQKGIRENWKAILPIFGILFSAMLLFLSHFYIRYVPKRNQPSLPVGSVPFMEFFGDQLLLIIGLGALLFALISLAVLSWKSQDFPDGHLTIIIAWGLFAFYAVNAGPFYYKLSPFRAWMVLAIPAALLAGEGIAWLLGVVRGISSSISPSLASPASVIILVLLLAGIYFTSFSQKYAVNTAAWSPGGFWTSGEEIAGYLRMQQELPFNAKVFTFSNNALINAFDKYMCHWCPEQRDFQKEGFNKTAQDIHAQLRQWGYEFLIIDGQAAQRFGVNATNAKVQELVASNTFLPQFQNQGIVLLKVG